MSRVVPQLKGAFRVWHQNNRYTATKFPRDYTHVATVLATSAQDARDQAREGDRNITYEGGMSVPRRETLPGDIVIGPEGRGYLALRDHCPHMTPIGRPIESVDPPQATAPEKERER